MTTAYTQPTRWQRLQPLVQGFDGGLLLGCCCWPSFAW